MSFKDKPKPKEHICINCTNFVLAFSVHGYCFENQSDLRFVYHGDTCSSYIYASNPDEPWKIMEDARRYRWIKQQKSLSLYTNKTDGVPWTDYETKRQFYPSHDLTVNNHSFSGVEYLDDLIDQAMELYPITNNNND